MEIYVDRFEIYYTWYKWWKSNGGFIYYGFPEGDCMLNELEKNPQKIISMGREQGWWKK